MPYIKGYDRFKFIEVLNNIPEINNKGELEFCIFFLMKRYMQNREKRYSTLHDCTYAAMHCSEEFRRRFLDEREDEAMKENGDIG